MLLLRSRPLAANNLVLAIYRQITNPECRQYLLRQAFEEALHTHAFHYIVESLALDPEQVFNMYREIPSIARKDEFEIQLTEDLLREDFSTRTTAGLQRFLENLVILGNGETKLDQLPHHFIFDRCYLHGDPVVGAKRGTGGSEGIGYLKTTLDKKFFPELWEARTYLDVGHAEGGCPFAH